MSLPFSGQNAIVLLVNFAMQMVYLVAFKNLRLVFRNGSTGELEI